jgi:hypothetical protein
LDTEQPVRKSLPSSKRRILRAEGTASPETTRRYLADAIGFAKILTGEVEEDMGDSGKDKAAQLLQSNRRLMKPPQC